MSSIRDVRSPLTINSYNAGILYIKHGIEMFFKVEIIILNVLDNYFRFI